MPLKPNSITIYTCHVIFKWMDSMTLRIVIESTVQVVTNLILALIINHSLLISSQYLEPQCPVGSYVEDLSTHVSACVPCPTNSFSTMEGSRECTCFEGYFRTELEEPN